MSPRVTESIVEEAALQWLEDLGYIFHNTLSPKPISSEPQTSM